MKIKIIIILSILLGLIAGYFICCIVECKFNLFSMREFVQYSWLFFSIVMSIALFVLLFKLNQLIK